MDGHSMVGDVGALVTTLAAVLAIAGPVAMARWRRRREPRTPSQD